jgi:hypothetical protein
MTAGFEPAPFRTSALSWRLRPLGHVIFVTVLSLIAPNKEFGRGYFPWMNALFNYMQLLVI